jgi:septum site-determining protein MinC
MLPMPGGLTAHTPQHTIAFPTLLEKYFAMSKITIVSRPEQHLLIDISGCLSFKEAIEQLSAALLNANQFWQGTTVDLNLGNLLLNKAQLAQIIALTQGVGICAKNVFAENLDTATAFKELEAALAMAANASKAEEPIQVSSVAVFPENGSISATPQTEDPVPNGSSAQPTATNSISEEKTKDTDQSQSLPGSEMFTSIDTNDNSPLNNYITNAIEQSPKNDGKKQSLYIKQTLRAGQAISHKGDLIIIGDVNAGAEVLAEGDIVVWGSLRGIAHAGVGGNAKAEIRALRLQPIQLRIAHYIARSPDSLHTGPSITTASPFMAETAKLVDGKIRILREIFD